MRYIGQTFVPTNAANVNLIHHCYIWRKPWVAT